MDQRQISARRHVIEILFNLKTNNYKIFKFIQYLTAAGTYGNNTVAKASLNDTGDCLTSH